MKNKTLILSLILSVLFCVEFVESYPLDNPSCGNDVLDVLEECDYGSLNGFLCWAEYGTSCNYCTSICELITITNYCGDGILNSACEECDDGNIVNGDGCSATCQLEQNPPPNPVCGNNLIESVEQCDDGNIVNGDGCSSTCTTEQPPENETEENGTYNPPPQKLAMHTTKIDWTQFCEPNWQCSGWSKCHDEIMTRRCVDINNCDFSYNKPAEASSCKQRVLIEENKPNYNLFIGLGITLILLIMLVVLLFRVL